MFRCIRCVMTYSCLHLGPAPEERERETEQTTEATGQFWTQQPQNIIAFSLIKHNHSAAAASAAAFAFPLRTALRCLASHHNALCITLEPTCDKANWRRPENLASFGPHFSFPMFYFILYLLSCLCPRPFIWLVLSSGVISSQLQEDPASRAPAHHHQASYLCDSSEQHRVHTRCLPGGQAPTGRPVDHGQPWPSYVQLNGQLGQHQGSHHGHGVSGRQEARVVR